jgi:hypothetical protein
MGVLQLHSTAKTAMPVPEAGLEEEEAEWEVVVEETEDEEEVVVEKKGMELTEDALARHLEEMSKLFPKTASEEDEKDPGGSIWPELD